MLGEWVKLTPSFVGKHIWEVAKRDYRTAKLWKPTQEQLRYRQANLQGWTVMAESESERRSTKAIAEAEALGLKIVK